jgi:hypothetical protein
LTSPERAETFVKAAEALFAHYLGETFAQSRRKTFVFIYLL